MNDWPFRADLEVQKFGNPDSIYVGARVCSIFGLRPEEVIGQQYADMEEEEAYVFDMLIGDVSQNGRDKDFSNDEDRSRGMLIKLRWIEDIPIILVLEGNELDNAVFWEKA